MAISVTEHLDGQSESLVSCNSRLMAFLVYPSIMDCSLGLCCCD